MVHAQVATNLTAAASITRSALPLLRSSSPSRIVHISSLCAHFGLPFQALYAASKAALNNLCDSLRYELDPLGVKVILIEPGSVRTGLTENRLIAPPQEPYLSPCEGALQVNDADEIAGLDPEEVGRRVASCLETPFPADRYVVAHWHERLAVLAQRFLPARVFRAIIRSHYRLPSHFSAAEKVAVECSDFEERTHVCAPRSTDNG